MSQVNTYLLDSDSPVEVARLIEQDDFMRFVTGLAPREERLAKAKRTLDIGCGPGGWPLDTARSYPQMQVIGVDNSEHMLRYASTQGRALALTNVDFQYANALEELPFQSDTFDYIGMRFGGAWIPRDAYHSLLVEIKRVLKPGGTFCWTEGDGGTTTSPAYAKGLYWLRQAMSLRGLGFGSGMTSTGVCPMMRPLLNKAGFTDITLTASIAETSYGDPYHSSMTRNFLVILRELSKLASYFDITNEEFESTLRDIQDEMQQEDFVNLGFLLTSLATKPE